MRRRSKTLQTDDEIAAMTLSELTAEIERCKTREQMAGTAYLEKAFFARIRRLERVREEIHGIPPSNRRKPARRR